MRITDFHHLFERYFVENAMEFEIPLSARLHLNLATKSFPARIRTPPGVQRTILPFRGRAFSESDSRFSPGVNQQPGTSGTYVPMLPLVQPLPLKRERSSSSDDTLDTPERNRGSNESLDSLFDFTPIVPS